MKRCARRWYHSRASASVWLLRRDLALASVCGPLPCPSTREEYAGGYPAAAQRPFRCPTSGRGEFASVPSSASVHGEFVDVPPPSSGREGFVHVPSPRFGSVAFAPIPSPACGRGLGRGPFCALGRGPLFTFTQTPHAHTTHRSPDRNTPTAARRSGLPPRSSRGWRRRRPTSRFRCAPARPSA